MLGRIIIGKKKCIRRKLATEFEMLPEEYSNIEFARDRMDEIGIYLRECLDAPNSENSVVVNGIDDVTWNDLEMDEMFFRLNHTRSFIGEQVLYKRLRSFEHFPEAEEGHISFLSDNPEKRIDIEQRLNSIGKHRDDYYLPMILSDPGALKLQGNVILRLLQLALIICGCIAIITRSGMWCVAAFLIAVINLTISMFAKNKYESLLFSVGSIKQMVELCRDIERDKQLSKLLLTEEIKSISRLANRITRYIGSFQIRRIYNMSGDVAGLILDYIMGITLYDLVTFNKVIRFLEKHDQQIIKLYEYVGGLDMDIAIASFRKRTEDWCVPDYSQNKISAEQLRHPALEGCVPNGISVENDIMLTGANASGKSTFMKALAINVILSRTINTACATTFKIPRKLNIISSMALRDDILTGESYYIREINQLKKMLDIINQETPTLILIDEILKGTNSVERVAASYGVLKYLQDKNAFVIVATHDINLVELVKDSYKCYYFGSDIIDGKILFDYKLYQGINSKSNAIQLLELIGLPDSIIEEARTQVKRLKRNGSNVG